VSVSENVIFDLSEGLLGHYRSKPLISKYDVYQHLMGYWAHTMQDDCYLITRSLYAELAQHTPVAK
jgi:hypothetical protein